MPGVQPQKLGPVYYDNRDYSHDQLFGTISPQFFPQTLGRTPRTIKDQGYTSFCTAFATSTASEYQELMELSPEWQAAKESQFIGVPILNGADPKKAMQTGTIFGFLPQKMAPYTLKDHDATFLANYKNWDSALDDTALLQRKAAYVRVDGSNDTFDNIRNALYIGQDRQEVVMVFSKWFGEWNSPVKGVVPTTYKNLVSYHAYTFIDWKYINGICYLVAQLSQGTNFGDGGLLYFSREIVNSECTPGYFSPVGCFIYKDVGQATVDQLNQTRRDLISIIIGLLQRLAYYTTKAIA